LSGYSGYGLEWSTDLSLSLSRVSLLTLLHSSAMCAIFTIFAVKEPSSSI